MINITAKGNKSLNKILVKQKENLIEREQKLETAYDLLVNSTPKTEIDIRVKEYFFSNIPENFKVKCSRKVEIEVHNDVESNDQSSAVDAFLFLDKDGETQNNRLEYINNNSDELVEAKERTSQQTTK